MSASAVVLALLLAPAKLFSKVMSISKSTLKSALIAVLAQQAALLKLFLPNNRTNIHSERVVNTTLFA